MQFCRAQYEHEMRGRFFKDLQQSVEGRNGEHVHLIDDIDALFDTGGRENGFILQGPDVVDAVVGCGVELHHVKDASIQDAAAGGALVAWAAVHGVFAVHGPGQDLCAGGFACAACADEKVSVGQPSRLHLPLQCGGDMRLTDYIVKCHRPPFSIQSLVHGELPLK